MFQTKSVERIKTYFMSNNFFFRKSYCLLDYIENYRIAGDVTDDNVHVHFTLDNSGYKHTLRICNPDRFSKVIMIMHRRLTVTFIRSVYLFLYISHADYIP